MAVSKTDAFQYRCPFCLEEDKAMVDPRLLPCKHEVCLPCLQDYMMSTADPRCEQCGVAFDPDAVADLSKLVITTCKACASRGNDVTAVSFCLQCKKPMCHQHIEGHNDLFESDNHKVITMYQYLRAGQKLKVYCCAKHPSKKLDGRCSKCLEFDCSKCRSFSHRDCPIGGHHTSVELPDVEDHVKEQQERIQGALNNLIVIKKKTSDQLTAAERWCDAIRQDVKLSEQQVIDAVRLASQHINSCLNDSQTKLKKNASQIDQRLELVQQLSQKAKVLLTETHDLDILKGGLDDQLKRDVDEALKEMPDTIELPERVLVQKAENIQFRLVNKKPSIKTANNIPVNRAAFCVSHTGDGQLVVGRDDGFDFLVNSGKILHSVQTPWGDITGLSLYKGYVYVIHKAKEDGPERQVQKYSLQGNRMRSWKVPNYKFINQLAIVEDRLFTRSYCNSLLLAFSLTGEPQPEHNIHLPAVPHPDFLCAAPPGGLIISDYVNNLVAKYTTSGQQVWTYTGLNKPSGASIDEYNRVWAASSDGRIHILSPSGQFICELSDPDIKRLHDLSISGDQLACAADEYGLLLYRVDYETLG